ncbi:hypothetical protein [Zhihengliuella flava]|uniref:Uncharacterized protein n=1 Tax=Zhihengliuella flava TaxID=1285193 RepID=A0A931GFZ8_9MICC|nr:hypothetical protein [Zhihengliuella flava]MBG6085863.1 hypothetical protein [Zhihengliuella flava]
MQAFDDRATLAEEFVVRLVGKTSPGAALPMEWGKLFKVIQAAVDDLSDSPVPLQLTGMSRGSTVLHLRSAADVEVPDVAGLRVHETALASAVRALLRVVDGAESEGDLKPWADKLDGFERFAVSLSELKLTAGFKLLGSSGAVRSAQLTGRGLKYLGGLSDTQEKTRGRTVSGRVTELKSSGHVKVKAGVARNSTAYDVVFEPSRLSEMGLTLGKSVSWRVEERVSVDRLGRISDTSWTFIEEAGDTPSAL